jgi:hypothetical protein
LVPVAVVVVLGAAGTLLAVETAERTATAYSRYLERADVGDLVINPSLATTQIDQVIRSLSGVRKVTTESLFLAGIGEYTAPFRYSEIPETSESVRGSLDGRRTTMDRLAYRDGRAATGPQEAVVSVDLADAQGLEVGDVIPLTFLPVRADIRANYFGEDPVVTPLGVERLEIVGIATFPDEVLPDGLYPRGTVVVSPDVAARYDCLPDEPAIDATFEEAANHLTPDGCSTSYRYWSLDIDGGDEAAAAAQEAFIRASSARRAQLPPSLLERDVGYIMIATNTAQYRERVAVSVRPIVTAVTLLGVATGFVTVALAGLAVARALRRIQSDHVGWWRLGMRMSQRTWTSFAPVMGAIAVGTIGAVAVAFWSSPLGPIGSVRAVERAPARGLGRGTWLFALALLVALVTVTGSLCWRSARRASRVEQPDRRPRYRWPSFLPAGRPDVTEGLRAAGGTGRGGGIVIAAGTIAAGTFVAAVVFGTSLTQLLDTPAWYGWPWQVASLGGGGYGGVDKAAAEGELERRDDVERWTGLGFTQGLTMNGRAVPALLAFDAPSRDDVTVISGRLPIARDEVAVGSQLAAEADLSVGEEVTLAGDGLVVERDRVSGVVVLPALGPYQSDRATPGYGMLLPTSALEPDVATQLFTFMGIEVAPGHDPEALVSDLEDLSLAWDTDGAPVVLSAPVRPAEIINAQSMRLVPLAVAVLLITAAFVGLAGSIAISVAARRHELGILRVLGFTGRQVRRLVLVQSTATVLAALLIGFPLGVIVGRAAWQEFASQLGVVTTSAIPAVACLAILVGSVVAAGLVALAPARRASRAPLAEALRRD